MDAFSAVIPAGKKTGDIFYVQHKEEEPNQRSLTLAEWMGCGMCFPTTTASNEEASTPSTPAVPEEQLTTQQSMERWSSAVDDFFTPTPEVVGELVP